MKNRHDVNLAAFPLLSPFILTVFLSISLFYLPTTRAIAQNAPLAASAPLPGDQVFADFESGTYDGWTIQGDCWGKAPATDDLFNGQITGFQGQGFACTLSPRRGSVATGRATSRDFTIQKPFIRFLIGGGNFPGQACLNLIVEGKVAQTATGDGTATLARKEWDVTALRGKTAHLEIVDSTEDAHRGYVLIDNIIFADRSISGNTPSTDSDIPVASSPLPPTPDCLMTLTPTHTVRATMSMSLSAAHSEKGIMKAYITVPPEIPGQHVLDCTLVCDNHPEIKAHKFYDLSPLHRPIMGIAVPLAAGELAKSCNFTATYTVALASMAPPASTNVKPVLDESLRKIYLLQGPNMDFLNPSFQQWARSNDFFKHASESDLDFAYRVFKSIVENGEYTTDCGNEELMKPSNLCQSVPLNTNCEGYSILFVGLMRLNGLPSEVGPGRWSTPPKVNPDGTRDPGLHMIARLFDPQKYGWFDVDISTAITSYRKNPDLCFGRNLGHFIISVDGAGIKIPNGPSPAFPSGIIGRWEGSADPISWKNDWNVEILK